MKLFKQAVLLIFNKFVRRKSNGYCLKIFCTNMGMAYIKLCQMLALQNIGNIFTEQDRLDVLSICYDVNPVPFSEIKTELRKEYGILLNSYFTTIGSQPIGSASVSQVHRAVLKTGEDVVLKIKRRDIQETVDRDIKTLRMLCKRFGWMFGITNHATSIAWEYYFKWLTEEMDFKHEIKNIKILQKFANSVVGKCTNTGKLIVPKVYEEYCTDNVIVMEYIPYKTINKIDDKDKIVRALNSYIRQSFYALFNDISVVYHGDMHPGNLFIDDDGNLGFLDMGLVFEINAKDAALTRELFMSEITMNVNKLSSILEPWFKGTKEQYNDFVNKLGEVIRSLPNKCVSSYFMDIVFLCLDVNLTPPYFLFCMAKAFVCLFGADSIYMNDVKCKDMLSDLILEYQVKTTYRESVDFIKNMYKTVVSAVSDEYDTFVTASKCLDYLHNISSNYKEIMRRLK